MFSTLPSLAGSLNVKFLIEGEEDSFRKAVDRGERELESRLGEMDEKVIPGDIIFEMYGDKAT